jgi:hypothetical protein
MFYSLTLGMMLMQVPESQSTLVAAAVGFGAVVLILWGTKYKRTEIFGHALLFSSLGVYFSGVISSIVLEAKKVQIPRDAVTLAISSMGALGPALLKVIPKWINKKAGLDD